MINTKYPYLEQNFIIVDGTKFRNATDVSRIINTFRPTVWGLDYIQYFAQISAGNALEQNRNVMEVMATMKVLTETTDSLGIMLSQLRKKDKNSLIHFPRVDDLEWSGLIKQLSRNIGICFWPYKIKQTADINWFTVSWQKVRYGKLFNEVFKVYPEYCNFELHPRPSEHPEYFQW
jgi:replicative DNA helicase